MVRIPSEYQEVEYIESTGTQYIDTEYIPVLSPILRMKIRVTDKQDRDIAGFVSNAYPSFIIDSAPAQSRWYNRYGNTAAYGVNPGPVIGQIQEWEWGKEVKFNENLVRTNAECDWSSNTQKMNIFSGRNKAFVAIYSCSLYDEDLVRNFIPCYRKSDNEIGMYDTVSKTFFTNQGTGTFLKGNDVSYDTLNLMESRRRILLNTPHLESLSGSILSFKTDMASKLKECKIHFTPMQEGSGDPSPDNVRPIVGWDGVTVTRCGKNLLDTSILESGTFGASGNDVANANRVRTDWIKVLPNTTLTFSVDSDLQVYAYNVQDASRKTIYHADNAKGTLKTTYTLPSNGQYIRIAYARTNTSTALSVNEVLQPQIELGSTATDYEPYTETSFTIPFPKTIYGGYVDLVKGEVVEEQVAVTLDGENIKLNRTGYNSDTYYGGGWVYASPSGLSLLHNNRDLFLCDKLPRIAPAIATVPHYSIPVAGRLYYQIRVLKKEDYTNELTPTEAKDLTNEWLQQNPVTVIYPLKIPNTYPLDPVTIRTLRGQNSIWSDANGNIEIKYWTH